MIDVVKKEDCSGCYACVSACPTQCITMKADDEGFWYPSIDNQKCIKCKKCEKMCQSLSPIITNPIGKAYAAYSRDIDTRMMSSSGGIFTLLAEEIISRGGVVFGAAMNEEWEVNHICVSTMEGLARLRGSKYVQSNIGDAYKKAKEYLDEGTAVLFSGTPCQIVGLLHFLPKKYEHLFTVDIVCHGVPSPMVWKEYLKYKETIERISFDKTRTPLFRDKSYGWKHFSMALYAENGNIIIESLHDNLFLKSFLKNLCLRPSCYYCHSKGLNRASDITLADFWGVERKCPEMYDEMGVSLVFTNSDKGMLLFEKIEENSVHKEVDIHYAVEETNTAALKSVKMKSQRKRFMNNVETTNFEELYLMCSKVTFVQKVYGKIGQCVIKIKNFF